MIQEICDKLKKLSPHLKLEECSKIMFFDGEYKTLLGDYNLKPPFIFDNVNYSKQLFEDVLPLKELLSLYHTEPSYASITGNYELKEVILSLEYKRVQRSQIYYQVENNNLKEVFDHLFVTSASGTTGAVFVLFFAIMLKQQDLNDPRDLICYNTPNYCLTDAFAKLVKMKSEPIIGEEAFGFLPSIDQIIDYCLEKNPLICFLTYPTNPTQALWSKEEAKKLDRLLKICQSKKIYLVVDSVFQDLTHREIINPEIFLFAHKSDYICKVTSPSKDRPFANGLRIGYLLASQDMEEWIEKVKSLTDNSTSTVCQIWLAFDSIFRQALLEGQLKVEYFQQIENKCLFGFGARKYTANDFYDIVIENNLFQNYKTRLDDFYQYITSSIDQICNWSKQCCCFQVIKKPSFGNTLFVKVKKEYFSGDDNEFFIDTLFHANTSSLIGSCFGLKSDEIWFRIAIGGSPTDKIIIALTKLDEYLYRQSIK